jgi:hypothetical protein
MRESCPAFPLAVCEGGFPPSLAFLCVVVFSLLGVIRRLYLEAFSAAGAAFWGGGFLQDGEGALFGVFTLFVLTNFSQRKFIIYSIFHCFLAGFVFFIITW